MAALQTYLLTYLPWLLRFRIGLALPSGVIRSFETTSNDTIHFQHECPLLHNQIAGNSIVVFAKTREGSIQPRSQCLGALDDCRVVLIQRRGSGALLSVADSLLLAIRFEPFMESDIALRSTPVER